MVVVGVVVMVVAVVVIVVVIVVVVSITTTRINHDCCHDIAIAIATCPWHASVFFMLGGFRQREESEMSGRSRI